MWMRPWEYFSPPACMCKLASIWIFFSVFLSFFAGHKHIQKLHIPGFDLEQPTCPFYPCPAPVESATILEHLDNHHLYHMCLTCPILEPYPEREELLVHLLINHNLVISPHSTGSGVSALPSAEPTTLAKHPENPILMDQLQLCNVSAPVRLGRLQPRSAPIPLESHWGRLKTPSSQKSTLLHASSVPSTAPSSQPLSFLHNQSPHSSVSLSNSQQTWGKVHEPHPFTSQLSTSSPSQAILGHMSFSTSNPLSSFQTLPLRRHPPPLIPSHYDATGMAANIFQEIGTITPHLDTPLAHFES
ncbi:hypothetical protein DL93DRAFT_1738789 [Clavulina sp. PMI_390]|nr:hypothetical protein DL93DRAFT_1738789 [Clavulina sp. PMI_390]